MYTLEEMYEMIPIDTPITRQELSRKWDYSDRIIRDYVKIIREEVGGSDGNVLVSFSDNSGYFRTSKNEHIKHYINENKNRIVNTYKPCFNQIERLNIMQFEELLNHSEEMAYVKELIKREGA